MAGVLPLLSAGVLDNVCEASYDGSSMSRGFAVSAPLQGTATGRENGVAKITYTHDAMIDLMIANPLVKQSELAATFGYTPGWVSRVIGSDSFQARLAERKADVVDPELKQNLEERLQGLAHQSLEVIQRKLEATSSPEIALKTLELTTKALGMGARVQVNANQTNNYVVALPPKVESENAWANQARGEAKALADRQSAASALPQALPVQDVEARAI